MFLIQKKICFNKSSKKQLLNFSSNIKQTLSSLYSFQSKPFAAEKKPATPKKPSDSKKPAAGASATNSKDLSKYMNMNYYEYKEFNKIGLVEKILREKTSIAINTGSDTTYDLKSDYQDAFELNSKRIRHFYINGNAFSSHKHIIPIKRLRTNKELLVDIIKKKEICLKINGREEFDEINAIVDLNHIRHIDK